MNITLHPGQLQARWLGPGATATRQRLLRAALLGTTLLLPGAGQALDLNFGPFVLTGFAKAEITRGSNRCSDCQLFPNEARDRVWADELIPGRPIETSNTTTTLFQPYLGANFDLGGGFKAYGLRALARQD